MHEIGILEVVRAKEEGLQTLLRARDDGGVVTKEQPAQDSHQDDAVEVAFVSVLLVHNYVLVLVYILNTPNCCGGKGWFKEAAMPKARILRVSTGSMMPSSQRRAVL